MEFQKARKQRIIREAINLFAERGVDATTTLQIAEVAGVTEPLIFYYFKNKNGLFSEIIESSPALSSLKDGNKKSVRFVGYMSPNLNFQQIQGAKSPL